MKTFKDLNFEEQANKMGIFAREDFDNDWSVTVVQGTYTHGGLIGLYELAVWLDGKLNYHNVISKGDVVGWLREEDVSDAMKIIQKF
tara:strand:+ start:117 stop:377 length:261 start_codon:yes stop_codon:yes gene_type:complete